MLLVLLMLAFIIHVIFYSGFNNAQKRWFIVTFGAVATCAASEFALHCGYYHPFFKIPLTILTIHQFALAPAVAMLFAGALGLKHQVKAVLCCFGTCILIGIICAPQGWVFYFGDDGYHRGPFFIIYLITYFGSLIYIIAVLFIVSNNFRHRDAGTIIMVLVVLVAGIIPMTFYQLHIAYIAVGMACALAYVFYNDLIQQDTKAELVKEQKKLSDMQILIIERLSNLIDSRDAETGEHVERTSEYVRILAEDALANKVYADTINEQYIKKLCTLSPMHDVGKIMVPDEILRKPGKLTPEEFEEIKKHAVYGGQIVKRILKGINSEEDIKLATDIATGHHERWDGKGYPKGLKGEDIPLSARIMAIADVFDALVSKRCYKDAVPTEEAFKIIEEESGTHFDPYLAKVFLDNKEKYVKVVTEIEEEHQ